MNVKKVFAALQGIEKDRMLTPEIVMEALEEALIKAARKQITQDSQYLANKNLRPEAQIRVDFSKNGEIKVYHQKPIVEDVEFEELELDIYDAEELGYMDAKVGDVIDIELDINMFTRAAVILAKNVMKQKIREAEKRAIYEEYKDYVGEMVSGDIESIEPKFILVNLGKTMAIMSKYHQNPLEQYREGQRINVIITEVLQESKGAQVIVSRTDPTIVKRLFEREVPEIYDGTIEIKAIAREAGERTKMAVYSHNPNVEAIGSCIGVQNKRVQAVINELSGEKIDIFEWKDDIKLLVENALAPAKVEAVIEQEKNIIAVVADDQLSLAIGKKGKNARLAVRLVKRKIDIKSISAALEMGLDLNAQPVLEQEELQPTIELVVESKQPVVEEIVVPVETEEVQEIQVEKTEEHLETVIEEQEVEAEKVRQVDISDVLKQVQKAKKETTKKASKPKDKEERKIRIPTAPTVSKNTANIYSEEELEEIERQQELEERNSWIYDETDFDEYDDYYDNYE